MKKSSAWVYEKPFGKANNSAFLLVIGTLSAFICAAHLVRASLQWPMVIGSYYIPVFWSWIIAIMAFIVSSFAFNLERRIK